MEQTPNTLKGSPCLAMLYTDKRFAWLWLILRVYVGYEWITSGWGKISSGLWTGANAGGALAGFLNGSVGKMAGAHPDVSAWYGYFIQHVALPHVYLFSHLVAFGELLVGAGLILGIFTGVAAFFGAFMNLNFMLAGTVSTNPILFVIEVFLVLAWRSAGYIGLDKWALPMIGTPWQHGTCCKGTCCGKPESTTEAS